jgi:peroxiredoxin
MDSPLLHLLGLTDDGRAARDHFDMRGFVRMQVTFKCRVRDDSIGGDNPFTWKDVTTNDIMKGKRVVVFALPGAFTPTCSSTHLPGYEKQYEAIKACGVDEIYW